MFAKRWILLVATLFLLPLLTSCSEENNERKRSVVEISAVGNGGVVFVAPWNAGNNKQYPDDPTNPDEFDDFREFAHVPITLKNRAYNEFITAPDYSPYGHFHVTEVSVHWTAVGPDAAVAAGLLPVLQAYDYTAMYDVVVPKDSELTFTALLLPQAALQLAPLKDLAYNFYDPTIGDGSTAPFIANAEITIRGHESGSEDEIELKGSILAEFVGVIIDE